MRIGDRRHDGRARSTPDRRREHTGADTVITGTAHPGLVPVDELRDEMHRS